MNKKFYLLGLYVAASATIANAQQLPNVGFGDWKEICGESMNTAGEGSTYVRPGKEPASWNGSSVLQNVLGADLPFVVVEEVSDGENNFAMLKNGNAMGNTMPAFISLSTPWVFVYGTNLSEMLNYASAGDGGSYGGIEFAYKPDAVSLKYRRTATEGEIAHVIAYLWNGTYKSNAPTSVSGSKPDFVYTYSREMENIDRVILGKQKEAETVIQQGKLIASCDHEINADTKDWEDLIVPLNYNEENLGETPDMVNVIISSADYWTRGNMKANSRLDIDDVDFVYYSTLMDLKVNDEDVALEDGEYEYSMTGSELPTAEQVVAKAKSQFAEAAVTVDAENAQVRIVVTNQGGKDVDGETLHTYVLQYEKAAEPERYQGYLNIEMEGSNIAENQAATIEITETGEGKCTFVLPDLTLANLNNMYLGDIEVSDVTVTVDDNETKTYAGSVKGLSLAEGAIGADVELNGTIDANGICDFKIDVLWNSMMGQPMESPKPINVTFTTNEIPAGVEGINGDAVAVYGVAGAVAVSGCNGTVNVYAADGRLVKSVMVDGNAEIALDGGLYIVRAGGEAYKVFVK